MYARVVFLKLGEIDTIHEKFNADAFIETRWREPALDGNLEMAEVCHYNINYIVLALTNL